ncbi:SGNH/GDSL hydrolase family protein [Niabella yanshanensis]|uniref:SGNH/GDSL hydrolase family protein n=1 Tax=Niabella yanshanensis TaxID=577386 RepID=A0ABZ0W532_9BACT|nr:SGNH/GDSL hydrolase family protein [Niabella yanshanensis]WQD37819.1 SGNH/GDSL hydrolase family protein [Niabella yanshanensis]
MKKIIILLVSVIVSCALHAQQPARPSLVYTDGFDLNLVGQAFPLSKSYHRIDTALYPEFPPVIKRLLTHSAGLVISFKTNSPRITAKWCVTDSKPGNNMTPIMNKGLDLYIKRDGVWEFAGVGRPEGACNEYVLVQHMNKAEKECLLYLPLYDKVKSLSVGIDSGYQITKGENPYTKKKVALYGSSITQGASASRPGMAYPARLSRDMGIDFINLGLSGNGKMEKVVANMVATIRADAFVLDCFANPSPEEITQRTAYMVKAIRAAHPAAPIILVQTGPRESGNFDSVINQVVRLKNENTRIEFEKLKKEGVQNLYLIRGDELLGRDHEGTTDGVHPNDLGFDRMLQVIKPEMAKILQ